MSVRPVLAGVGVLVAGILPWSLLAQANLQVGQGFPWGAAVELVYLALLWQYLAGKGWPASTSATRRLWLRANKVPAPILKWAFIAGGLMAGAFVGMQILAWYFIGSPRLHEFQALKAYPSWTVAPMLVMGAIVAGLFEEVGFRGYMQVPLEQRHGPVSGVGIVAALFAFAHFSPLHLLGGMGWGLLAFLSNSILPGIVIHAVLDASVWLWAWLNLETVERIVQSGASGNAVFPLGTVWGLTLAFWAATALAFWKLVRVRAAWRAAANNLEAS